MWNFSKSFWFLRRFHYRLEIFDISHTWQKLYPELLQNSYKLTVKRQRTQLGRQRILTNPSKKDMKIWKWIVNIWESAQYNHQENRNLTHILTRMTKSKIFWNYIYIYVLNICIKHIYILIYLQREMTMSESKKDKENSCSVMSDSLWPHGL